MLRHLFLPFGLLLAIPVALLQPAGGKWLAGYNGIQVLILLIFVISGYQSKSHRTAGNRYLLKILFFSACSALLLSPLLGLALTKMFCLPHELAIGLLVIASVPPTLSSGIVITEISGGNTNLALFLTIGLNILGIFSTPLLLNICLQASGPIALNQMALLGKMIFLVLLPFILGKAIRHLRHPGRVSPRWSYVNSSCVILVVYISLSVARQAFTGLHPQEYAAIIGIVAGFHGLLLLINATWGKMLHLAASDQKAVLFVNSQKTLPISIAILANMPVTTGSAVIVCLMFHFVQLVIDSTIGSLWGKQRQANATEG